VSGRGDGSRPGGANPGVLAGRPRTAAVTDNLTDTAGPDDVDDPDAAVAALYDRLAATGELPVERSAARWIGEAEAVAGDLVGESIPAPVRRERIGHVRDLLANVDSTGHPAADEHVAAAARIAAALLDEREGSGSGSDPDPDSDSDP